MSSLKMTFSLTSLIFLIAFGLVFVPASVMAHNASQSVGADGDAGTADDLAPHTTHPVIEAIPAVAPNPNADPPTLGFATVPPHGAHPTVAISLKAGDTVSSDGMEAVVTSSAAVVTLVVQFNMPTIVGATNGTGTATDATLTNGLLTADSFTVAIRDNSGTSPLTGALVTQATTPLAAGAASADQIGLGTVVRTEPTGGSMFEVPLDIATDAIPNGTAMDAKEKLHLIIRVNEGAGYGLQKNLALPDGLTSVDVPGGESQASMVRTFTLVDMLTVAPDTTAPTVTIAPPAAPDAMDKLAFTLTFSEPLGTGLGALTVSDIEITGGTAMATDLSAPTAGTGDDAGKEIYTLTVTPTTAGASVMIALRANSVADAAGNPLVTMDATGMAVASTMASYDKTAPVITVTSAAGTGDDDDKVIFTIDSDEALGMGAYGLSIADITVSNAPPLKVADLMMVEGTTAAPLPTGVKERHTLTITPTDGAMANMLDITGGSVADAAGNMADGVRHTYTPTPSDDEVDTGPPPAATQIGSKAYLVLVPTDHDADALPDGIAKHTVAAIPDLSEFFSTGGTIDVAVKGKANHNVIITEIMVAKDIGKRGVATGVDRPAASQWIEIYNNTAAHINIADITVTFKTGFPAAAAPTDATDRLSNVVSGAGWGFAATFPTAVSGQSSTNTETNVTTVTKNFISLRRVHKDNKALQDGATIQNGWLSGSWALTADSRVYLAGRIGTPGSENRPTVFSPAVFKAPTLAVTFNEIANLSDDTNEWIELKGAADYNMRKHKISIVTAYDKAANTGTETTIFEFPDNDDIKIPASGILLLTDKSPTENKLEADLEDGVEKPVRYRIKTLAALPNSGDFLLVLRNKDGVIFDVAGHLAGLDDDDPYTLMWPLAARVGAAKDGHISAKNKLAGGNVYKRARAIHGYLSVKDNGDEPAYEGAGFTGVGYDRNVSPANKEHHGTPGYDNGIQIGAGAEATTNVVISEVMYGDGTHSLPQWIEIQNRSATNSVDLHNWKLYVVNHSMNADGSAFAGKAVDGIFLRNMKIPPRQTALVVSKAGQNRTQLPPHRVLNLKRKGTDALLSSKGFYLYLVANAHEGDLAKRQEGDAAGNLPTPKEVVAGDNIKLFNDAISTLRAFQGMDPVWELPAGMNDNDYRVSIARKGSTKILNPDGTAKFHWVSSIDDKRSYNLGTSYGRLTDIGSPGNTPGAALPVSLSTFRPERLKDTGEIVVRWVTESELNNAGFNILRSEKRDKGFTKVHYIAGQGTTSERTVYEWKDKSAKPNVVYYYQIQDVSLDGKVTTLRTTHLRGNVTAAGKLTTTWAGLKALQ